VEIERLRKAVAANGQPGVTGSATTPPAQKQRKELGNMPPLGSGGTATLGARASRGAHVGVRGRGSSPAGRGSGQQLHKPASPHGPRSVPHNGTGATAKRSLEDAPPSTPAKTPRSTQLAHSTHPIAGVLRAAPRSSPAASGSIAPSAPAPGPAFQIRTFEQIKAEKAAEAAAKAGGTRAAARPQSTPPPATRPGSADRSGARQTLGTKPAESRASADFKIRSFEDIKADKARKAEQSGTPQPAAVAGGAALPGKPTATTSAAATAVSTPAAPKVSTALPSTKAGAAPPEVPEDDELLEGVEDVEVHAGEYSADAFDKEIMDMESLLAA